MTEVKTQYFSDEDLKYISKQVIISDFKLISTDTYSDEELWETIKNTGKAELLLCTAIQMCVVGFGNKIYGNFEYKGVHYDIKELFQKLGIKYNLTLQDKINPNELTPRRIQRFFRMQVYEFLIKNNTIKPYLWRKYSIRDTRYRTTTFPGAESLITGDEEIKYLIATYNELDHKLGLNISNKVQRVFEARGLNSL